jgi:type I pantothenate kinase
MRSAPQHASTPFDEISREDWARLSDQTPLPLTEQDAERLRGLGDRLDLDELDAVYRPISHLLSIQVAAAQDLRRRRSEFLDQPLLRTPYVIAVAGSVAVGKSTTARLLRELMSRWPDTPRVQLVTTDGFLYPNSVLESRGIMHRKGFPESYDRKALLRFVAEVKAGTERVEAPVYSHLVYDIVSDQKVVVERPDVLIIEGLNVLQAPRPRRTVGSAWPCPTSWTSPCTSTAAWRTSNAGTWTVSCSCGRRRSPTRTPISASTPS